MGIFVRSIGCTPPGPIQEPSLSSWALWPYKVTIRSQYPAPEKWLLNRPRWSLHPILLLLLIFVMFYGGKKCSTTLHRFRSTCPIWCFTHQVSMVLKYHNITVLFMCMSCVLLLHAAEGYRDGCAQVFQQMTPMFFKAQSSQNNYWLIFHIINVPWSWYEMLIQGSRMYQNISHYQSIFLTCAFNPQTKYCYRRWATRCSFASLLFLFWNIKMSNMPTSTFFRTMGYGQFRKKGTKNKNLWYLHQS